MDRRDAPGQRYETRIDDGVVFVEGTDGWIEVGSLDDIVEFIGGETYVVEYDSVDPAAFDWLATDDQRLEIDVRETIQAFAYSQEFVQAIGDVPPGDGPGDTRRAEVFVDMVTAIWDAKGNIDVSGGG